MKKIKVRPKSTPKDKTKLKEEVKPSLLDVGKAIVSGAYNVYKNNNEDIAKDRLKQCSLCPLFKGSTLQSNVCNSSKRLIKRTFTEVTSSTNISELSQNTQIVNGCGCVLRSKSTVVGGGNTCPANNWDQIELYYMCIPALQASNHTIDMTRLNSLVPQFGITLASYTLKVNLNLKLISHKLLTDNKYKVKEITKDYTVVYELDKGISKGIDSPSLKLESYIDGTYEISSFVKIKNLTNNTYQGASLILSREDSKKIKIEDLYNLLEI